MRSFRSKPVGWRNESYRHYLAAKGIRTKYFATATQRAAEELAEKFVRTRQRAEDAQLRRVRSPEFQREATERTASALAEATKPATKKEFDEKVKSLKTNLRAREFLSVLVSSLGEQQSRILALKYIDSEIEDLEKIEKDERDSYQASRLENLKRAEKKLRKAEGTLRAVEKGPAALTPTERGTVRLVLEERIDESDAQDVVSAITREAS